MLTTGTNAPAFTLPDKDGVDHTLAQYKGQWVLIYFYPRDNTPGCTKEACAIRDSWGDFGKLNATVLGVSKDSQKSHANFTEKFNLPFTLLSDPSTEMIQAYDAWKPKKMMGREYLGIVRMSYLIDPGGKIAKIYPKVKPAEHADQVLADIRELSA